MMGNSSEHQSSAGPHIARQNKFPKEKNYSLIVHSSLNELIPAASQRSPLHTVEIVLPRKNCMDKLQP